MLYEFKDIADVEALPSKLSELCWHIVGFVDGDCSFPVVLSPVADKKFGWLIQPRFEVELRNNNDSLSTLKIIQRVLGIRTTIIQESSFVKMNVTNRRLLAEKIIPFFTRYRPVLKENECRLLEYVTSSLDSKKHLDETGFKEIIEAIYSTPFSNEQRRKWRYTDIFKGEPEPARRLPSNSFTFPEGADLRNYLAGFIDAEGALGFAIVPDTKTITPYLTITHSETAVLTKAQQVIQAGNISTGRLQIYGMENAANKVIPFLNKYKPITRRTVYIEFKRIFELIRDNEHKKRFDEIVGMIRSLNDRGILRDYTLGAHPVAGERRYSPTSEDVA